MTEDAEDEMEDLLAKGKTLVWLSDEGARFITKIGIRKDEEGMKVAYVDGGKPGDYIALYNVDTREIMVGQTLDKFL